MQDLDWFIPYPIKGSDKWIDVSFSMKLYGLEDWY